MNTKYKTLRRVALVILAVAVIGAVVIVKRRSAQASAAREVCIENLKQLAIARDKWASEHKERAGQPIGIREINQIIPYRKAGDGWEGMMPRCPANGAYLIEADGTPTCSHGSDLGHKLEGR